MEYYGPAILAVSCTVLMAMIGLFFRAGALVARITELERWRLTIREDMHEISTVLEDFSRNIEKLTTLIHERTDRRLGRHDDPDASL